MYCYIHELFSFCVFEVEPRRFGRRAEEFREPLNPFPKLTLQPGNPFTTVKCTKVPGGIAVLNGTICRGWRFRNHRDVWIAYRCVAGDLHLDCTHRLLSARVKLTL